mgnify:CR=1 FL=1|tara:strand:- start:678 stop:1124 length:447 start_codon:yes stop_codon:yes gene_type:complete
MIKQDSSKVTGMVNVVIRDETTGAIKQEFTVPNLVVDTGLAYIASRMKEATATAMTHMAVGTDTTAAASGNTALGSEIDRQALVSTTVTTNSVAYVATFAAGTATGALTEAGILNAASSGTMLCRTVFAVINKGAADSMTVTWTITIS